MKKAFTLIELLVVIVIMGVVYNLAVKSFTKLCDDDSRLTLLNLREYLSSIPHAKTVKLLCLDECQECYVYADGIKIKTIEGFLDRDVRSYRYEFLYGFEEKEKDVFFDDNDIEQSVCFSYEVDKNGVGDQVLVEFKDRFYDMDIYMDKVVFYDSMDDARVAKEDFLREAM